MGGGEPRGKGSAPSGLHATSHAAGAGPATCGDPAEPRDGPWPSGTQPSLLPAGPGLPALTPGDPWPLSTAPTPLKALCTAFLRRAWPLGPSWGAGRGAEVMPESWLWLCSPALLPPTPAQGESGMGSSGGGQPSVQGVEQGALAGGPPLCPPPTLPAPRRPEDPAVQLLPEAAHMSPVHRASPARRPGPGHRMVGGLGAWGLQGWAEPPPGLLPWQRQWAGRRSVNSTSRPLDGLCPGPWRVLPSPA